MGPLNDTLLKFRPAVTVAIFIGYGWWTQLNYASFEDIVLSSTSERVLYLRRPQWRTSMTTSKKDLNTDLKDKTLSIWEKMFGFAQLPRQESWWMTAVTTAVITFGIHEWSQCNYLKQDNTTSWNWYFIRLTTWESMPGFEEDKEDKRGSWDPNYEDPVPYKFDPTKPPQWVENGPILIDQPDGTWKDPIVYGPRKVLRFPNRPQIGRRVRWGEFKKPVFEEKQIDPLLPEPDPLEFTKRPPQYTEVPQKVRAGPPVHYRLHKAVASGDIKVSLNFWWNTDGLSIWVVSTWKSM